jgi:hypothetical protein
VDGTVKRFEQTNFHKNRRGQARKRTVKSEANIQAVANAIAQNPSTKVNLALKFATINIVS